MDKIGKFLLDTLFGVVFWLIVMMLYETLLCHMTIEQSLITRSGAIVINALTSGLNAMFIDWWRKKARYEERPEERKLLHDSFAMTVFQIPVYILILLTSHTVQFFINGNWGINSFAKEISWAFTAFPILLLSVGWLYGKLLDFFRYLILED